MPSPITVPDRKIKEGISLPFAVFFEDDDVTPKPLPLDSILKIRSKEERAGIEDLRIIRYGDGYRSLFVTARKPGNNGTKYSGGGATLSSSLKLQDRCQLRGLPYYMKDFVPAITNIDGLDAIYLNPRIPKHVLGRHFYNQLHSEHQGIWLAASITNLNEWSLICEVLRPLNDEKQIGAGTPSIDEVENLGGNLAYIHGMREYGEGNLKWRVYYSRAVLFAESNPTQAIRMTDNFLVPTEAYETNKGYRISHVFPMGVVKRKVQIGRKVYDAHLISAGTGDVTSSLYLVLVDYLKDSLKPMDQFKYHEN